MRQIKTVKEDIQSGSKPGVGRLVGKYSLKKPVKASCVYQPNIKPKKIEKIPSSKNIREYKDLISQEVDPRLFKIATYSICRLANF